MVILVDIDPYAYVQARVAWDDRMLDGEMEEVDRIVEILENPNAVSSKEALNLFGESKSINSLFFRQNILSGIMSRYFPLVSPVIRDYFSEANRSKFSDKQKKMLKEKKLTKFFGIRPSAEHMQQQKITLPLFEESPDAARSIISDTSTPVIEVDDLTTRRKKAEKLNEFFGEAPQTNELLIENDGLEREDIVFGPTINELSQEQKAELTRRARKLLSVLGETLDEKTVQQTVTTKAKEAAEGGTSLLNVESSPVHRLSFSADTASIYSVATTQNVDGRLEQKQRLDKLSDFLGHRIMESDILEAQSYAQSVVPARPLTDEEKKRYKKRTNKLEFLLGATIPANTIVNYAVPEPTEIVLDEAALKELADEDFEDESADAVPDFDEGQERRSKQNRLKKLRKILGIELKVGAVIKKQVIDDLEKSLSSMDDEKDRQVLFQDLKKLKELASRSSPTLPGPPVLAEVNSSGGKSK